MTENTITPVRSWDYLMPLIKDAKENHYKIPNGPKLYRDIELKLLTLNIDLVIKSLFTYREAYGNSNSILK